MDLLEITKRHTDSSPALHAYGFAVGVQVNIFTHGNIAEQIYILYTYTVSNLSCHSLINLMHQDKMEHHPKKNTILHIIIYVYMYIYLYVYI